MRLRPVLALAALAAGLTAGPAPAAGAGALRFQMAFGCLGCGWTQVSITGSCSGLCAGGALCANCSVTGGGEAYTTDGSICWETGTVYGDLSIGGEGATFVLSWDGPRWTIAMHDGTPATGVVVFAQPDGPCLGSATGSFTGVIGAAP